MSDQEKGGSGCGCMACGCLVLGAGFVLMTSVALWFGGGLLDGMGDDLVIAVDAIEEDGAVGGGKIVPPETHATYSDIDFMFVESGSFTMGSPSEEPGHSSDEEQTPQTINSEFLMSKFEITRGQYAKVMGEDAPDPDEADMPKANVSWTDAVEFCKKLSELHPGKKFRLPNEVEWEYACRAGSERLFAHWRDEADWRQDMDRAVTAYQDGDRRRITRRTKSLFNYDNNAAVSVQESGGPNMWGLYGMHGNLWEWCDTGGGAPGDPPSLLHRPIRGGGWSSPDCLDCRSAKRAFEPKTSTKPSIGFRVLLSNP